MKRNEKIRNIAIIAHVDHGKTTLVDELLKQSGAYRTNEAIVERAMDSNALEKERGITILSKNTAVLYNDVKINIVDTPGHADFGGEVERVLKMVDGVILLVDAFEGPMPQTRFVLKNALALELPVIVCVNKIDRPDARPEAVIDEVYDLFITLDANDEQIEFPIVYTSAKNGTGSLTPDGEQKDLTVLFEQIIENMPAPEADTEAPVQVLISTIDYNPYVGRIGIGKIERGILSVGDETIIVNQDNDQSKKIRITKLFTFDGLKRIPVETTTSGDIIALAGIEDLQIGDTVCDPKDPSPLDFVKISEPTLSMVFSVNNSPFAGRDGKFVTSRQVRDRLMRQLNTDVSLRVEETAATDAFKVFGRGELHLSILIETMRREGYEFMISKPQVVNKEINGKKHEPIEHVTVDLPNEYAGSVIERLGRRKGELVNLLPVGDDYTRLEFNIPARGLIGYRSQFMTDTKGTGVMNSIFDGYEPFKGEIPHRDTGSLVATEPGVSVTYALYNLQDRGILFIGAGEDVYEGMVVGQSNRPENIEVNVCKRKKLTSVRSVQADEKQIMVPPVKLSLEGVMEYLGDDELIEITPKVYRLRKKFLNRDERKRANR